MDRKSQKLNNNKIAVIGGGSWATALVKLLRVSCPNVNWWLRNQSSIDYIQKYNRNPKYLRSVELHIDSDKISNNLHEIIQGADIVFFVVPSLFLRQTLRGLKAEELEGKIIVSAIKGIIPRKNFLISEYFKKTFKIAPDNFVFLAGPSHAEEVANKRMTIITLASTSENSIKKIDSLLGNTFVKVRKSNDVVGLEYASILKNIYAIALGISHSLGYGDNYQAVLASNALKELNNFLEIICPGERSVMSSGYLGDLMATSMSQFSRNRTFGNMIGKGYTTKSALLEMSMIPEGYFSLKSIISLINKLPTDMRIVKTVYNIIFKKASPAEAFIKLEKYLI